MLILNGGDPVATPRERDALTATGLGAPTALR